MNEKKSLFIKPSSSSPLLTINVPLFFIHDVVSVGDDDKTAANGDEMHPLWTSVFYPSSL